jgi:hypothetical protein
VHPSPTPPSTNLALPHDAGPAEERFRRIRWFGRAFRNGMMFVRLPGIILKIGRSALTRRTVAREHALARAARKSPFWGDIAVAGARIPALGKIQRHLRVLDGRDLASVSLLVEERLGRALTFPRQPLMPLIERRPVFGQLDAPTRTRLTSLLQGLEVPRTGSHGDMHLWNHLGDGEGYRLIDWEHFDPDGTFVYDYLDFHFGIGRIISRLKHPEALASLREDDRAIRHCAIRTGLPACALLLFFIATKIDTLLSMPTRGFARSRARYLSVLSQSIAAHTRGPIPGTRTSLAATG